MAILCKLDSRGGFTCGDTSTGRASYAYPTSDCATRARRDPHGAAVDMLKRCDEFCAIFCDRPLPEYVTSYHARLMADLMADEHV